MVIPFLTLYLTTILHFGLDATGVLVSAFGIGSLVGALVSGYAAARTNAQTVIFSSLFVGGLLLISLQFPTHFLVLFSLLFLYGVIGEAYRPAMSLAVSQHVPAEQTGRSMALLRLAINLGMTAAPTLGGFIILYLSYKELFWIDGLTCIAAAIYFWFASRHWSTQHKAKLAKPEEDTKALPPYKNGKYLLFLLATFLLGFSFVQMFFSVPVFLKEVWGYKEYYYGLLCAGNCLMIVLLEMPLIHFIEHNKYTGFSLQLGLFLTGTSFLFFLLPGHLAIAIVMMFLFTLGEILYMPLNNAQSIKLSPASRRSSYISWYWMTWSMTNIAGPSLGLLLADKLGYSFLWIILFLLISISFLLNRFLQKKKSPKVI